MRITVIGAGRVGTALGDRWAAGGHDVVYGVRDPADPRHAGRAVALPADAAPDADVVLLAVPWGAVADAVADLPTGDAVVVDATNPLAGADAADPDRPVWSGAELIAEWTGSTRVVKAFNTTGSANMIDPTFPTGRTWMPVAGDDDAAKAAVLTLADELGFEATDVGPLSAARDLEHLAALWIRMAYRLGRGPGFAFGLHHR